MLSTKHKHGLVRMPELEEALAAYLAPQNISARGPPKLTTKPCRFTAELASRVYACVGQASHGLNTAVFVGESMNLTSESPETPVPLTDWRHAMGLSLRASKMC